MFRPIMLAGQDLSMERSWLAGVWRGGVLEVLQWFLGPPPSDLVSATPMATVPAKNRQRRRVMATRACWTKGNPPWEWTLFFNARWTAHLERFPQHRGFRLPQHRNEGASHYRDRLPMNIALFDLQRFS